MGTAYDEEYLTVAEAAALFKVSQSTIWRWINRGEIPAFRVGRRGVRLKRAELMGLMTHARQAQSKGVRVANSDRDKFGPLTEAEQKVGLVALAKLRVLREELLRRREGPAAEGFPNAAEDLHNLREQRTEQRQ